MVLEETLIYTRTMEAFLLKKNLIKKMCQGPFLLLLQIDIVSIQLKFRVEQSTTDKMDLVEICTLCSIMEAIHIKENIWNTEMHLENH
jgi:hypothetical protein